jgi:hypothetical protein
MRQYDCWKGRRQRLSHILDWERCPCEERAALLRGQYGERMKEFDPFDPLSGTATEETVFWKNFVEAFPGSQLDRAITIKTTRDLQLLGTSAQAMGTNRGRWGFEAALLPPPPSTLPNPLPTREATSIEKYRLVLSQQVALDNIKGFPFDLETPHQFNPLVRTAPSLLPYTSHTLSCAFSQAFAQQVKSWQGRLASDFGEVSLSDGLVTHSFWVWLGMEEGRQYGIKSFQDIMALRLKQWATFRDQAIQEILDPFKHLQDSSSILGNTAHSSNIARAIEGNPLTTDTDTRKTALQLQSLASHAKMGLYSDPVRLPECLKDTPARAQLIEKLSVIEGIPYCWERNCGYARFIGRLRDTVTPYFAPLTPPAFSEKGRIRYSRLASSPNCA